jgi:hypothetical protein
MSMLQAKVPDRRVFNVFPQSLAPYMIEATSVSMGNVEAMSFARWLTEEGFACVSDHDFILPSGQRTPWRFNWVGEVCPVGSAAARMKQCVRNYLNPLRKLPAPVRRYKGVDAASPRLRVLFQQQSQSECQAEQQHMAFDGVIGEGELGLLPTLEAAAVTKPERSQRSRASDQGPDSDGVDSPTQEELTHEQQEKQDMVACFLDVSCLEAMLEALEACEAKAAEGGAGGDIEDVESELHLLSCMMEGCIVTRRYATACLLMALYNACPTVAVTLIVIRRRRRRRRCCYWLWTSQCGPRVRYNPAAG